jgi:hypothetical protein
MVYAYLSKKVDSVHFTLNTLTFQISIPHGANIYAVGWDNAEGWLACGGGQSILKVLRLESGQSELKNNEIPQKSSVTSQNLEGHSGKCIPSTRRAPNLSQGMLFK